jgi:putative tryptophan/tyrosine transport system substrate-binding protein
MNTLNRRAFTAGAASLALAAPTLAQQRRRRFAYLSAGSEAGSMPSGPFMGIFEGLSRLGYQLGRDYEFVYRWADGYLDRLPALAEEIVAFRPDIIVCSATAPTQAARRATATIPILCPALGDPDVLRDLGLIEAMNRPGGNVTGISNGVTGLQGKKLQFAAEMLPSARRIGTILHPTNPTAAPQQQELEEVAAALRLTLIAAEVRTPEDLAAAFQMLARERVEFVFIPVGPMLFSERSRIAALAKEGRIPLIGGTREQAEEGFLLNYGVNLPENFSRAAYFIDRILKGDKPADLPVEFPTKLELIINGKTAKALGIEIPFLILARADEVIE